MKKILITGCNGYLASGILETIDPAIEISGIDLASNPVSQIIDHYYSIDITKFECLYKTLKNLNIDVIIHLAAIANVDYCELHPLEAQHINTLGTQNICKIAQEFGTRIIFTSSASIFDGIKGDYSEDDIPNPINVYAKTKVEGEHYIETLLDDYIICRFNLYGFSVNNQGLLNWIITQLQTGETIKAFNDVIFNPLSKDNFAEICLELISLNYKGILHLGSPSLLSKYDFAQLIAEEFSLDKRLIKADSIDFGEMVAKRPKNTSLNISLAEKTLKTELKEVKSELKSIKQKYFTSFL